MAFLDRIEDANKREVDHVRQCLTGDCERFKLGAEPCTTCTVYAYEREMAAKYAEIETALKKQNDYHAALLTICTADKNAEGLREIAIDACNGKEVK